MNAVFIVAGVAVLYFLVTNQDQAIAAKIQAVAAPVLPADTTSITIGTTTATVVSGNNTDEKVTKGLSEASAAANMVPVAGQIASAVLAVAAKVASVFTGAHQKAVAKQAASMQKAVPMFLQEVNAAMNGLGQGAISEAQTVQYLQQAQSDYYTNVSNFIKKCGVCKPFDYTSSGKTSDGGANCATADSKHWQYCTTCGPCNEGCGVGCGMIESTVAALTKMINAGGGSYTMPAYTSSDLQIPSVTWTYQRPAPVAATVTAGVSGFSSDIEKVFAGL